MKNLGETSGDIFPSPPTGWTQNRFELLRYIDWYGNTVFNRLQMETFLREWERLRERVHTSKALALHLRIKTLAEHSLTTPHLCVKFYGD